MAVMTHERAQARGGPRFAVRPDDARSKPVGTCPCGKPLKAAGVTNHMRSCRIARQQGARFLERAEWHAFEVNLW